MGRSDPGFDSYIHLALSHFTDSIDQKFVERNLLLKKLTKNLFFMKWSVTPLGIDFAISAGQNMVFCFLEGFPFKTLSMKRLIRNKVGLFW